MSERRQTPEEVISAMTCRELQELLSDMRLDSSVSSAFKLKRLVARLGRFEDAVEALSGQIAASNAA